MSCVRRIGVSRVEEHSRADHAAAAPIFGSTESTNWVSKQWINPAAETEVDTSASAFSEVPIYISCIQTEKRKPGFMHEVNVGPATIYNPRTTGFDIYVIGDKEVAMDNDWSVTYLGLEGSNRCRFERPFIR